jgi:cell division protein FtsQ
MQTDKKTAPAGDSWGHASKTTVDRTRVRGSAAERIRKNDPEAVQSASRRRAGESTLGSRKPPPVNSKTERVLPSEQSAAARNRKSQKRKQQLTKQVRHFESLIPRMARTTTQSAFTARMGTIPSLSPAPLLRLLRNGWLWSTLALITGVASLVFWVHSDEGWFVYREDVLFTGLDYLSEDELYPLAEMEGWNIFYLNSDEIAERIERHPYVADARVAISRIPVGVDIDVTPASPIALWVSTEGTRWLLPNGLAVEPRGETADGLMQLLDPELEATALGQQRGEAIDPDVVESAKALLALFPTIDQIRFNADVGLNFRYPNEKYYVYWGDGRNVERKLENLKAAQLLIDAGEVGGTIIDVRFERPVVR